MTDVSHMWQQLRKYLHVGLFAKPRDLSDVHNYPVLNKLRMHLQDS